MEDRKVDMEFRKRAEAISGPPYWLLVGGEGGERRIGGNGKGYDDVLTVEAGEERILPLFESEEAAVSFLGCLDPERRHVGWHPAKAGAGELLAMLSANGSTGPGETVEEVAFDPPETLTKVQDPDVPTVGRRVFTDWLLGNGGSWSRAR